jgi:hypothetical protein
VEIPELRQLVDEALREANSQISNVANNLGELTLLKGHIYAIKHAIDQNPQAISAVSLVNSIDSDLTGVRDQYDALAGKLEEIHDILHSF